MADTSHTNDRNSGAHDADGVIGGLVSRSEAPTPQYLIELAGGSPYLDLHDLRVG